MRLWLHLRYTSNGIYTLHWSSKHPVTLEDIFFGKSSSSNFTRENMSWCSFSQYITLWVPKTMTLSFHSSTVKFLATEQKKTAVIHLEAKMSSLYELSYYTVFRLRIIKLDLPPKRCIFDRMSVKPSCVWEVEVVLCFNFQIGTPCCYTDNFPCLCHSFTTIPFKKWQKWFIRLKIDFFPTFFIWIDFLWFFKHH